MKNTKFPVRYSINCKNPEAHLFEITCTIETPNPDGQILSLPNWIPGSYMIRDFSRNITKISSSNNSGEIALTKINKNTWQCAKSTSTLRISYTVYAFDLSVRSAHLDTSHAFFNGTSVFIMVHGFENTPCSVEILKPAGSQYKNWKIATTLATHNTANYEFGEYYADDYDELIDHPVEIGHFTVIKFNPHGIEHELILTGRHTTDQNRIANELTKICETHINLFGEFPEIQRYLFLTMVVNNGYGGLEHRSSTSLVCSRNDLINGDANKTTKEYRQFLALCSHEYFHTWNVKRIKPAAYMPYKLDTEAYTQQLWAFEGITSYYDELTLARSGVISTESYLELLSQTITRVWRQYGRLMQSVADSSFDAWTKFYKQDENAPNAIVSYYTKGTLIALALDLTIRIKTDNKLSLDDLMHHLWQEYGKKKIGLKEGEIEKIINELTNIDFTEFFNLYLYGTDDLPLTDLFNSVGVDIKFRAAENQTDLGGKELNDELVNAVALGIKTKESNNRAVIQQVINNSCAQQAGLSAGDEIVSFDGLKVTSSNLNKLLSIHNINDIVEILAFRRDEIMHFTVTLQAAPLDTCVLSINTGASYQQKIFRNQWLHTNITQ